MLRNNKRGEIDGLNIIFTLIIGVVILVALAFDLGTTQQKIQRDINEINVTNTNFNQTVNLVNTRIVGGSVVILNSSCRQATTCTGRNGTLSENNEFTINLANGKVLFINRTGEWNVTYDYKPSSYADSSITRTILSFVAVFAALAMLAFVARSIGQQ